MAETPPAGATPVEAGATPAQTAAPTNAAPEPATGDPEALGDAGKRALDLMKSERDAAVKAAKAAEKERDELKSRTQTDQEKAVDAARKEGATEALTRANERIRRSEVRAALTAAGVNPALLDLAPRGDEFSALKVDDDGEVEGLTAAVEAFKTKMPDLFKSGPRPDFGGGPRGTTPTSAPSMNELIRAATRPG